MYHVIGSVNSDAGPSVLEVGFTHGSTISYNTPQKLDQKIVVNKIE